jgi:hypothetical protein
MKKVAVVMLTAILLSACSSKELFNEQAKETDTKMKYAASFLKTYPNVNIYQSWDYSNKNEAYSLPTSGQNARRSARAAEFQLTNGDEYEVDNNTLAWMKGKLKDGQDNRSLGKPFYMKSPGNSFTIVPIFQGQASSVWELHAVIDGVDFKVWEKGKNIWVKKNANSNWQTVESVSNTELYKNTENAYAVKAQTYTFSNVPVGAEMYFYLTITKVTNSKYNYTVNSQMSSLNGMMLSLNDCPRPANIAEDNQVMIIGCEDVYDNPSKGVKSDNDMNDVVFMIYGKPEVPSTIEITEDMSIEKKTTVRYMIEDLGSTDDFDFNDVVVDVSEIWTSSPVFTNGVLTGWTDSDKHQEAIIRHLGGTLPFKLTIGNTQFAEHEGVLGSDPDEKYEISGWNKDLHNISIMVRQAANSTVYNNVVFPKAGEAPMIIAVEPTQAWMKERQSVPESWFTVPAE